MSIDESHLGEHGEWWILSIFFNNFSGDEWWMMDIIVIDGNIYLVGYHWYHGWHSMDPISR